MNEAQRRELEAVRREQTVLADRFSQLEARLRAIETDAAFEEAAAMPPPPPSPPLPPPLPPPVAITSPPVEVPPLVPPMLRPAAPKESLEVRIGTTWLVRVGVVMMLTALAFLGSYLYKQVVPQLGPAAKLGLLYLGAGALAGAGAWLERSRQAAGSARMLNFARVVLAGGLAAVYYVTYAAHWNPHLAVLASAWADGALLVGWAGFMVWLADRRDSEGLATFAVLLAYYASAVDEIAAFTLVSNLVLTAAAVFLGRRHLWRVFPYASLLATFGSYGFWRFFRTAPDAGGFWLQAAFLAIYWLLFTWSVVVPGAAVWNPRRRAVFATLNNAAFFLLVTWLLAGAYPGAFWKWSLGFGLTLGLLSEACRRVQPRVDADAEGAYFLEGVLLITLGFFAYFNGWQLGLVLAAQSVVLLGQAQGRRERLPLWASLASAAASFVVTANVLGDSPAIPVPWPSVAATGALLVFNAWWSRRAADRSFALTSDVFAALGSGLWLWTVERALANEAALVPALAAGAAVLTASVYVLRVRALPFLALAFLAAAYVHRIVEDDLGNAFAHAAPAWSVAALLLVTLGLGHWWQRRWPGTDEPTRPARPTSSGVAGALAVLAVLLMYDWLRPADGGRPAAVAWIAENALLSLALLAYGLWTRYRSLAAAGQLLLLVSFVGYALRVWPGAATSGFGLEAVLALMPLAVLLVTLAVAGRFVPETGASAWPKVYEVAGTLFFLAWVDQYVPAVAEFAVLGCAAAVLAGWAQVRREPRWRWWAAGLVLAGAAKFALLSHQDRASFVHLLGIAALAGQQQFARRWAARQATGVAGTDRWQAFWMIAATLCAWAVLSARVTLVSGGAFTLAASWSVFAAFVFAAGLTLHEKVYRWLGLGLIVCTLARIATVDIWEFDSLGRAVSALCLGVVLLGVGYFYNRFHAKWHGLF